MSEVHIGMLVAYRAQMVRERLHGLIGRHCAAISAHLIAARDRGDWAGDRFRRADMSC